jgi:hypothetical protein
MVINLDELTKEEKSRLKDPSFSSGFGQKFITNMKQLEMTHRHTQERSSPFFISDDAQERKEKMKNINFASSTNSSRFTRNETTNHALQSQSRINTFLRDKRETRTQNLDIDVKRSGFSKKFLTRFLSSKRLGELNLPTSLMAYPSVAGKIHAKRRETLTSRVIEQKLVINVNTFPVNHKSRPILAQPLAIRRKNLSGGTRHTLVGFSPEKCNPSTRKGYGL